MPHIASALVRRTTLGVLALGITAGLSACRREPATVATVKATPVYSQVTGRLEQLTSDRDGDGKIDTRAFMDGTRVVRIEIDRNGDGRVDRWEYYVPVPPGASAAASPDGRNMIDHADEANGPDDRVTRKELYQNGVIQRVEEDTDADGRIDKWEAYREGQLTQVSLDLQGKGFADRRLTYGPDGSVRRVEADPDGDGAFTPVVAESSSARAGGSGR
jgi:hypothetical protein